MLHKYVALYATTLIKEGRTEAAMDLYVKHGTPPYQQNYNIYKRIASDMLKAKGQMGADSYRTWADLRDMLHDLVSGAFTLLDGYIHSRHIILFCVDSFDSTKAVATANAKSHDNVCYLLCKSLSINLYFDQQCSCGCFVDSTSFLTIYF